jgi:Domain of unknown function (DUF4845)
MRSRQTGVTLIGWLFLLAPVGVVLYAIIRLTPLYLNYMKVSQSLEQVATEFKGEAVVSPLAARSALQRRFDVQSIDFPKVKDIGVSREAGQLVLEANYEDVVPLFAGLSLLVHFEKRAVAN